MKLLVTAGPTREPFDPVRFLSNRSSGKMGYAIVDAALAADHDVVLITGPTLLKASCAALVIKVETAAEMLSAVCSNFERCDALVMVAAVTDWRPKFPASKKIKKNVQLNGIELERTEDILGRVCKNKGKRIIVGFSAETENLIFEAERKLRDKSMDLIVANDVSRDDSGFEVDNNRATFLYSTGKHEDVPLMTKRKLATKIVAWVSHQHRSN